MNLIKINRLKKNLSQGKFAKKCGYNQSFISKLEAKTINPSFETIYVLADNLDICHYELFSYFSPCDKCKFLDENGNCIYGEKHFTIK